MKARISITEEGVQAFQEVEVESVIEIEGRKFFFREVPSPYDEYIDLDEDKDEDWFKLSDWASGLGITQCLPDKDLCLEQLRALLLEYSISEIERRADAAIAKNGRAND